MKKRYFLLFLICLSISFINFSSSEVSAEDFLTPSSETILLHDPLEAAFRMETILPCDRKNFHILNESTVLNMPPIPDETTENLPVHSQKEKLNDILWLVICISGAGTIITAILIILLKLHHHKTNLR